MREVNRSAILPYPDEAMFDLVADVDAYAEFLPWCTESAVQSRDAEKNQVVAMLAVSQAGLAGTFSTCNTLDRPRCIDMSLVEGPFSELEGQWLFEALGTDGCKLTLIMRFAFSNPMKDMVLGAFFERTCNELVDAFVGRAQSVYG
jgi:ribosome-associated toxin RatA of RatAB toxin-antitoxin module